MYKVKGKITKIEEVKTLDNGAKVVNYILEHTADNGYVTPYNVGLYKGAEYAEHVDNFVKYNKVGDEVNLEFTIRGSEYNGKVFNNINHWKIDKLEATQAESAISAPGESDDLPY